LHPAVDQIHEVQEELTDQLEPAKVHDLSFAVLEFREAPVKLRPGIKLETQGRRLPRLKLQSRHADGAFDAEEIWTFGLLDIERLRPKLDGFGIEWREQIGEELVGHSRPLEIADFLTVDRLGRAFLNADERIVLGAEPIHIDAARLAVRVPGETCVARHVPRMDRARRA